MYFIFRIFFVYSESFILWNDSVSMTYEMVKIFGLIKIWDHVWMPSLSKGRVGDSCLRHILLLARKGIEEGIHKLISEAFISVSVLARWFGIKIKIIPTHTNNAES